MEPQPCSGSWRLLSAEASAASLGRVYDCPLLDAGFVRRHSQARKGRVPVFEPSCAGDAPQSSALDLLKLLHGRTLLLLGDSISEQHFYSLACSFLSVSSPTSWWPRNASARELWKTRTCLPFEPAHDFILCYVVAGKSNEHLQPRPWVLSARLRSSLQPTDVVLMNVGVHLDDAITATKVYEQIAGPLLKSSNASSVAREGPGGGEAAGPSPAGPLVIFRETAPQHFAAGVYNRRNPPPRASRCTPLPERWADAPERNRYNEAILPLLRRDRVPVLDVWRSSAMMHAEHVSRSPAVLDCTHWILPGVRTCSSSSLSPVYRPQDSSPP